LRAVDKGNQYRSPLMLDVFAKIRRVAPHYAGAGLGGRQQIACCDDPGRWSHDDLQIAIQNKIEAQDLSA